MVLNDEINDEIKLRPNFRSWPIRQDLKIQAVTLAMNHGSRS